jgi:hypothetical protein
LNDRLETCPTQPFDFRSESSELSVQSFIAAVEVADSVNRGFAVGGQTGEDQSGTGAKIGSGDGRAA